MIEKTQGLITITKYDTLFIELKWLLKALSKDKSRLILHTVKINADSREIVAVDGRRMHVLTIVDKTIELPASGLYSLLINNVKEITLRHGDEAEHGTFPNWKAVIPNIKMSHDYLAFLSDSLSSDFASEITFLSNKRIRLNDGFIGDALGKGTLLKDQDLKWRMAVVISKDQDNDGWYSDPILIESLSDCEGVKRKAVIMPIRQKNKTN